MNPLTIFLIGLAVYAGVRLREHNKAVMNGEEED